MTLFYQVFGLTFRSSRPIVSLAGAMLRRLTASSADVAIEEGRTPPVPLTGHLAGMRFGWDGSNCLIEVDEVGTFNVTQDAIVVQRLARVSDREVDAYLLGTAFGALLHLRGRLPVHCNAVTSGGSAALFCGASGAGKSTLAAYFMARGREVLTDDLCAVERAGSAFVAHSGIPRLKLWRSAVEHLDISSEGALSVPWCEGKVELPNIGSPGPELPIAGIYYLPRCERVRSGAPLIEPLSTLPAVNAITSSIYRRAIGDISGQTQNYLRLATRLVASVPVFQINRTWGLERFHHESEIIAAHLDSLTSRRATAMAK